MEYLEILSAISLPLGVLILLLLVCRSLVLWYFRIPDMVERQDELIKIMQRQNKLIEKLLGDRMEILDKEDAQQNKPTFTELRYGK